MTLIQLAWHFEERKMWLVTASGLEKDALHIYFGLTLFFAVRLLWRWRGSWLAAWVSVVAMACGGEWLDLTAEASHATIQPDAAHWHDIWNTAFWPTVILLLNRWLFAARPSAVVSGEDAERRLEQA